MIFGYSATMRPIRKKRLLMALGVVATIPLSLQFHSEAVPTPTKEKERQPVKPRDPRVDRLQGFLRSLDCPVAAMSAEFVRVADENHLDWRLLPSIAVIESGGGKAYKNNNIFGWDGGERSFVTIQSGLELVAYKLGRSPLYRHRNVVGKLRVYNEHEDYPDAVISVMNRISPHVRLRGATEAAEMVRN